MNAWIWVGIVVMAGMAWATYRLGRAAGRENPPMARDYFEDAVAASHQRVRDAFRDYQPQIPNDEAILEALGIANEDRQP